MERLLSGGRRVGTVHGAYMRTSLCTFWTQTLGCFGADDGISSSLTLHIFPGGGPPETNGRETLEAGDCVGLRARGCCADESRFLFAIGCARQERPCLLDASAQWPLSEGMILAFAPTAALPSGQQFCCADVFEVTADGCIPLAPLSREPVLLG